MRKFIYILPLMLHATIVHAGSSSTSVSQCWEMVVDGNNNEVTFCIDGALFYSNTYHPNKGTDSAPTTCKQLGIVTKPGEDSDADIRLLPGVCTNGMSAPIPSLACNIKSNDLYCLYGGAHELHLKPTHNKSLNTDAQKTRAR